MPQRPRLVIYADKADVGTYAAVASRFPVEFRIETEATAFAEAAREADWICMARKYERSTVLGARRCRWLHVGGTGIDRLYPLEELDPTLVISNTPGLNPEMMADYVLCVMLMLAWDFPRIVRNQTERRWERWGVQRVQGQTLALIGLGDIGRPVAHRAAAHGMRVIGVKRTPEPVPEVERVFGPDELHLVLGQADFVVLAIPLTLETRGLLGAREFAAMKPTGFLINVSRGPVVQESQLIQALKEHRIAGAALDVFDQEPLPQNSELWSLKNVIVTPHISATSMDYRARSAEIFGANLERYLSGRPLLHVIDRTKGY